MTITIPLTRRVRLRITGVAAALLFGVSGCAVTGSPDIQLPTGPPGYSSEGPVTEISSKNRGGPITFSGTLDTGLMEASSNWAGEVLVVNFWYAACGPCRAEAPDLEALHVQFQKDNVTFVGVNVRDEAGTALSFARRFGVTYSSFLDANDGQIQLAFAGKVAPNAVPTTLVLDRKGRIAARIVGRLDKSILNTLIADAVAEPR